MSEAITVVLRGKDDDKQGVITFDGQVIEIFGFRKRQPERLHISQVADLELSFKSGLMATPMLRINQSLGSWGLAQPLDPDENEQVELERLAAAIEAAASGNPDWSGRK